MIPPSPTPEWAIQCFERIVKGDDPDQLEALLALLVAVAPSEKEEKYKHEIAWAAIEYGYTRTEDCHAACRRYLGIAV